MDSLILFPGTFDPFTVGHESIVRRALGTFDRVHVAVGCNMMKKPLFPIDRRIALIRKVFADEPRVSVASYEGLTADYAREVGASAILRGIRTVSDFEQERSVADANRHMAGVETLLLFTEPQYSFISSSVVRELLMYHKPEVRRYLPSSVSLSDLSL